MLVRIVSVNDNQIIPEMKHWLWAVTEVVQEFTDFCRLSCDGGTYYWPKSVLEPVHCTNTLLYAEKKINAEKNEAIVAAGVIVDSYGDCVAYIANGQNIVALYPRTLREILIKFQDYGIL